MITYYYSHLKFVLFCEILKNGDRTDGWTRTDTPCEYSDHFFFKYFPPGTANNIEKDHKILYLHMVVTWMYPVIAMILMRRYLSKSVISQCHSINPNALWIVSLPKEYRSQRSLRNWLNEKYPGFKDRYIFMARCTARLHKLFQEYQMALRALQRY